MDYFYLALMIIFSVVLGYLFGSISFALIISKLNGVDLYKVGSGNAGGTNVGRALGKKWAFITIGLDVLKTIIPVWVIYFVITFSPLKDYIHSFAPSFPLEILYFSAALASGIGHKFPIYYHFKGGKAVSCYGGFVLGTNFVLAILGMSFFLLVFKLRKRVSLASVLGVSFVFLLSLVLVFLPVNGYVIGNYYFGNGNMFSLTYIYSLYLLAFGLFVIICHSSNIKRLVNKTEPETHYKKNGEPVVKNYNKD